MADQTHSQTDQATVWLKPEQVEEMRSATVANSASYLAGRNDALIALLYDTGLRVSEAVALDTEHLVLEDRYLSLPADLQKEYPTNSSPRYREIQLKRDTARTLQSYLANRWKESPAVFPSRQKDRMTTESVRNVIKQAAVGADIEPFTVHGRGDPEDVTPHTLRHSVAYRMLNREEGNTLNDVKNRLRHETLQTTERVYEHFDRV